MLFYDCAMPADVSLHMHIGSRVLLTPMCSFQIMVQTPLEQSEETRVENVEIHLFSGHFGSDLCGQTDRLTSLQLKRISLKSLPDVFHQLSHLFLTTDRNCVFGGMNFFQLLKGGMPEKGLRTTSLATQKPLIYFLKRCLCGINVGLADVVLMFID